jgi:hypothetical protein
VVVFNSAIEGFFLTHYDFLAKVEDTTSLPPGPTGLQPLGRASRHSHSGSHEMQRCAVMNFVEMIWAARNGAHGFRAESWARTGLT